jgi:chemotaxis protein methyltransferase CheR
VSVSERPAPSLSEQVFRLLRESFHAHAGLWFGDEQRYLLEHRLASRLALHDLDSYGDYHRFLRFDPRGPAELRDATELLTTNESYFCREPEQLQAFEQALLPRLAGPPGPARKLRILSAGCATGEEAYTVAALVLRSGHFTGWELEVVGTDLSRRSLAAAQAAVYGEHAFRSAEGRALRTWFEPVEGRWRVGESLRRHVRFTAANLLDAAQVGALGRFDVVFCRNVLFYFETSARKRVLGHLHGALREGGWLLLGHAESLIHVSADFELVHLDREVVYRRPVLAGRSAS